MNWPGRIDVQPEDLFSKATPTTRLGRFFNFPLCRIFVVAAFVMPVVVINSIVVFQVIEKVPEPLATQIDMVRMVLTFVLLIVSYRLYCGVFEKREAVEIGFRGCGLESALGALLGSMAVTLTVAVLWSVDAYGIQSFSSPWILPKSLIVFGVGALFQDLVLLCVLYRLLEELTGSWVAILCSLLVFGLAHAGNPNATVGSVAALCVSSIVLLAPFILTRRLWLSWGIHGSWNFMQAGVFGMPNSGYVFPGWIEPVVAGPVWLTGGSVGIEGSYLAIGLDLLLGLGLLVWAIRRGQLVAPRWKRPARHLERLLSPVLRSSRTRRQELNPVRDAHLAVDAVDVVADRVRRDAELSGDVVVLPARQDELQHRSLSFADSVPPEHRAQVPGGERRAGAVPPGTRRNAAGRPSAGSASGSRDRARSPRRRVHPTSGTRRRGRSRPGSPGGRPSRSGARGRAAVDPRSDSSWTERTRSPDSPRREPGLPRGAGRVAGARGCRPARPWR